MSAPTIFDPFAPDTDQHSGGAFHGQSIVSGDYGYAVTDYETAGKVLRDKRFRNSALRLMEEIGITDGPVHDFRERSIIMIEGKPHLHLRSPLARWMGPARVKKIQDVLRGIIGEIADELGDTAPIDVHDTVARRIPSMVYCYLAGAPMSDAPKVQSISERTLSLLTRDRTVADTVRGAYVEQWEYLGDLIARKRAAGLGEDMLSYLIQQGDEGKLTEEEVVTEATSMLEASSVNTAHQASLVVWALLREPEAWQRIVADPGLIPDAVTEVLRLYPRTGMISKIATEDIEVGEVTIPAGSDVHIAVWSANRDPERFENPDVFDLDRERNVPLTFSSGPHNCPAGPRDGRDRGGRRDAGPPLPGGDDRGVRDECRAGRGPLADRQAHAQPAGLNQHVPESRPGEPYTHAIPCRALVAGYLR